MPEIRRRRAAALDEVRVQRSILRNPVTSLRPTVGGGVGWREDVPHIIIHSGDTPPASPFPADWTPVEYMEPYSARGQRVPVAFLRNGPDWVNLEEPFNSGWSLHEPFGYQYDTVYAEEPWFGYVRAGAPGLPWVAPPGAATVPGALEALAALDIAVVSVLPAGFTVERTYDDLLSLYPDRFQFPVDHPDAFPPVFATDWEDQYGGGANDIHLWGAAMAALTGAVSDFPTADGPGPHLMSYSWNDLRWEQPTPDSADDFVENFLLPRILGLAANMGNDQQFDIACCIDQTGSFGGETGTANRVFRTIIEKCREADRDIFVGVSTFEEYNDWSLPFAGEDELGRPFILQYPIASVADDVEFENLLLALDDQPPGGGGDTAETQIEALYQIATGVGFSGQNDGITTRSGPSGTRGIPLAYLPHSAYFSGNPNDFPDAFEWYQSEYNVSEDDAREFFSVYPTPVGQGLGYMAPGGSGDVPAFNTIFTGVRGGATVGAMVRKVWSYPEVEVE